MKIGVDYRGRMMKKSLATALFLLMAAARAYPQDVSFKLLGGMTWVQGDDYNKGIAGTWQLLRNTSPTVTGNYRGFKNAPSFQAEIVTHWGRRIAVGLGGGYFQISNSDLVTSAGTTADTSFTTNTTIKPQLSVIPFYLNVYYKIQVTPAVGLHVFAGPAFQIVQFSYQRQTTSTLNSLTELETFKAASPSLGYQGGASLTVRIARGLALVVDGFYRHGHASNFSGNWLLSSSSATGLVNKSSSTYAFWYYAYAPGASYPLIGFFDTTGPTGDGISGVRKADINLSGLTLTAGLRIDI
jgi:hypothetical protein